MTMLDDLHAIRVRANLIERNVSGLRPDDENGREFETWAETMALTGEQFHGIMLALRAAADAELGCGPTRDELEAIAPEPEPEPEPIVSLPRSSSERDSDAPAFVVTTASSSPWVAAAIVLAIALAAVVAALVIVTT
jgi:hypothetical protein